MRPGFAPQHMVRQFVAEVSGAAGFRFRVFTTGSDRHYLLVCTRNPAISFAVLRADLRPDVRAALAHGHAPRQERSPR